MSSRLPIPAGVSQVFLEQGGVHCTASPTVISTVLGSCIAICLWDPRLRAGGMNHFVLPQAADEAGGARYGDVAIDHLVSGMLDLGSSLRSLQAKMFGGAAVLAATLGEAVGDRNARVAVEALAHYRIPVVARRTGGSQGVLIRFATHTGEVWLRKVKEAGA